MEQHEEMLSPEEQYAQLAPTLDTDGFSLYVAAEEITGLKVYEEFPYEDNHGMFEMADGHTLLRYLEAAYFGTVTWEIVPGTPYERAILGEVDKTTPEYNRTLTPDTVQYVGIASDEPVRLHRLQGDQVSLLEKYHYTEEDAKQLCQTAGLLSPVYAFTDRGGCWFCPNAKRKELRHLYDHHPELWAKMLELQAMPGKVSEKFNRTGRFSDIDAAFRKEDALCPKAA